VARARNIKPGFYKNEDLAECSVWARLIFPGLWMLADREGRLEDRPKRIKGDLLPYDAVEIGPLIDELERYGFLVRYQNEDGRFIQITKFKDHQTPHYSEKHSVIKPPDFQESRPHDEPDKPSAAPENSGNTTALRGGRNPLNPESGFLNPDSLNPDVRKDARTPGSEAAIRMKAAGLQAVNPSHPKLIALLDAGITFDELAQAAGEAVAKGKNFAYALATAEGRRRDAAVEPLPDRASITVPSRAGPDPALQRLEADRADWKPPAPEVKAMLAQTVERLKARAS
jgi:hypothetical protein